MSSPAVISLDTVRLMLVTMQGAAQPPAQPARKEDVLAAIRRMGTLQIDTIHVVARSPYLVLFSRLGHYNPAWLEELEAEGKLFEYWSHAACFLPIEDYPLYVSRMEKHSNRYYGPEWLTEHQDTIERVMQVIRENGPVRSADFERTDGRKGAWWDWKVEKRVLEYLHTFGDLMIARREKFQRIYDLRERVLPDWDAARALPLDAAEDELTVRAVSRLGAAPARWAADYFRLPNQGMPARLKRLAEEGRLEPIAVEGSKEPWYIHPENRALLAEAAGGAIQPTYTTLLSPFDPLTWDRDRGRTLFNFDYTIECYTPAPKRRYGYFTLPILSSGQLIGRLDAKAHRKAGIFEVKAIYLEPWVQVSAELAETVRSAIQRCADWHATPKVQIVRGEPEDFAMLLGAGQNLETLPEEDPSEEQALPD